MKINLSLEFLLASLGVFEEVATITGTITSASTFSHPLQPSMPAMLQQLISLQVSSSRTFLGLCWTDNKVPDRAGVCWNNKNAVFINCLPPREAHSGRVALSGCVLSTDHYHWQVPVILSHCHTVTLSHCHSTTLSHCLQILPTDRFLGENFVTYGQQVKDTRPKTWNLSATAMSRCWMTWVMLVLKAVGGQGTWTGSSP